MTGFRVTGLSLATPLAACLPGEAAHVPGVLAISVVRLIIGHGTPRLTSGASRLQAGAVWRLAGFLPSRFLAWQLPFAPLSFTKSRLAGGYAGPAGRRGGWRVAWSRRVWELSAGPPR
jgi:hypothetical protein